MNVAGGGKEVLAFTFEHNHDPYVVYWHISGDKELELPVKPAALTLMSSIGSELPAQPGADGNSTILPVGNRRYVKAHQASKDELITAFKNARIVEKAAHPEKAK